MSKKGASIASKTPTEEVDIDEEEENYEELEEEKHHHKKHHKKHHHKKHRHNKDSDQDEGEKKTKKEKEKKKKNEEDGEKEEGKSAEVLRVEHEKKYRNLSDPFYSIAMQQQDQAAKEKKEQKNPTGTRKSSIFSLMDNTAILSKTDIWKVQGGRGMLPLETIALALVMADDDDDERADRAWCLELALQLSLTEGEREIYLAFQALPMKSSALSLAVDRDTVMNIACALPAASSRRGAEEVLGMERPLLSTLQPAQSCIARIMAMLFAGQLQHRDAMYYGLYNTEMALLASVRSTPELIADLAPAMGQLGDLAGFVHCLGVFLRCEEERGKKESQEEKKTEVKKTTADADGDDDIQVDGVKSAEEKGAKKGEKEKVSEKDSSEEDLESKEKQTKKAEDKKEEKKGGSSEDDDDDDDDSSKPQKKKDTEASKTPKKEEKEKEGKEKRGKEEDADISKKKKEEENVPEEKEKVQEELPLQERVTKYKRDIQTKMNDSRYISQLIQHSVMLKTTTSAAVLQNAARFNHVSLIYNLLTNYGVEMTSSARKLDNRLGVEGGMCLAKLIETIQQPLVTACQFGHAALIKILLQLGSSTEWPGSADPVPLVICARKGDKGSVDCLLKAKAKPNKKDPSGQGVAALHVASQAGHLDIVKLLIEKGADVNATTEKHQRTPLLEACFNNRFDVAEVLVEAGADTAKKDDLGDSPESISTEGGMEKLAEIIAKAKKK